MPVVSREPTLPDVSVLLSHPLFPPIPMSSPPAPGGPTWYSDAADYWKNVDATIEGMLGGFANLDDRDAADSIQFLRPLIEQGLVKTGSACDCGAGIGRVTKSFLSQFFKSVDLVEQDTHFINTAKQDPALSGGLVRRFINVGLQDFAPDDHAIAYDLVWCQWVLGHLTDADLVAFLRRMAAVCPVIGVKENVASGGTGDYEVDTQDSSVTRAERAWAAIFKEAGLRIVKQDWQTGWPPGLYRVKMWCLVADNKQGQAPAADKAAASSAAPNHS